MELINNRYKILKQLKQNRMSTNFLVLDMWNKNRKLQLNILNSQFIPNSLIDFYSNEFIKLINLNSKNIIKNYHFNRVSYIDNKKNTKEQYFYTCEYIEKAKNLLKYINDMNLSQTIDVFIEICKTIHYVNLNGYIYDALNLNNIFIVKNNENYNIKLKDLATVKLEKNCFIYNKTNNLYSKPHKILSDEKSDIYSLAVLLLTMFRKQSCKTDPKKELAIFRQEIKNNDTNFTTDEINCLTKLLPIIDKAITFDGQYPYKYVYDMIEDINSSINKNYEIVDKKELEKLNFRTKLVGRKNDINYILKSYDSMIEYKPSNRIFRVKGDTGTGKTRFLEEIKFLLELKNANVYSSFSLNNSNDSNNKLWTEILRKLIFEAETQTILKYQSKLKKFFPKIDDIKNIDTIEYINENITKYRALNEIAEFINESIKSEPAVFIIDNIHFANEFTIDTFTYLYKKIINNKNIILIFSYKENEVLDNLKFQEFIHDIKKREDSSTIYMENLNKEQTGQMIQNMMCMSYVPTNFSNRIYRQSYGNPLFITEVIKELFNSKIIFINDKLGWWDINIHDTNKNDEYYDCLHIPDTIEQLVLNQLENIDNTSHHILKAISIFTQPISIETLSKVINMDINKLKFIVLALVNRGILTKKIEDTGYVYDINNNILKDIVYKKINHKEKIEKHKIAAKILEEDIQYNLYTFDELIHHLEKANLKEKAKKYCIKNANKMRILKDIKAEIKNFKKALSMVQHTSLFEKTELLIKIGSLYFETGNFQLATNFFNKAKKLAKTSNNQKNLIDIYIYMAQIMDLQSNYEKTVEYLDKAEKLLKNFEYLEARLEINRIRAMLLVDKNLFDESIQACLKIIEECGENFNKVKGNTYRNLAYIYTCTNKIEEAILLYEKSIELLTTIGYSKGILISLNNIGCIYNDYYHDPKKALKYFIKVRNLSEEYGVLSSEILGLINIAVVYYARYNYKLAHEHFKLALEKALKANFKNQIFFLYNTLTLVCIHMDKYLEASHYYNLAQNELHHTPTQNMNIVHFYDSSAHLYKAYGDFEKADKFFIKTINFYKHGNIITKLNNIIDSNIIKLGFKEVGSYDSNIEKIISTSKKFKTNEYKISSLIETAIVLAEKNDFKNAKKLILEAKKYMIEPIHDEVQTLYYYSKGIVATGDDSLKLLLTALKLAKKIKNKKFIAKINIELGNHYFSQKNYYYAVIYYIEACEILRNFIDQIPDEYKLKYINNHNFAKPFFRIKYIKNILINVGDEQQIKEFKDEYQINSYKELYELIDIDEINTFIENKKFMDLISKQYMKNLLGNILTEKDILLNISGDTTNDLQLITKYLAALTLATKGLILTEGPKQELNIVASIDKNCNLPTNTRIFDRVRVTMEPLLLVNRLNTNDYNIEFFSENVRACLCIPIIGNHPTSRYDIMGYLYLESDRILNNFNYEGLQQCIEFSNLLLLLMEKHQLKLVASIDKLTGALTRKYLEDSLSDTLNRANSKGKIFSIIMYDLDRFKRINDRLGHQTGDEVLKKISKIVKNNINKNATLGRYGGEEFIIILPNVGAKKALSIAENLREKIETGKILGDKQNITISMGIVSYPEHGQTINELIEKVDTALYVAKEKGRNRCQLWSNDFINMTKSTNTIAGILTGNELKDSRNVLVLVELIELVNKNLDKTKKIYKFLGRIIEIIEAQFGILILIENKKIKKSFGRKAQNKGWVDDLKFNTTIVQSVVEDKQGLYITDWDNIEKYNIITGLPDWYSILAVPVIFKDEIKGVIYLSSSTRIKKFGIDDLNFVNVLSNLLATII